MGHHSGNTLFVAMMKLILNSTSTDNSQFLQIGHLTNPLKVAYISYLASHKLLRQCKFLEGFGIPGDLCQYTG